MGGDDTIKHKNGHNSLIIFFFSLFGVARPKIKSKKCTSNVLLMYGKKKGVKKIFPPILT